MGGAGQRGSGYGLPRKGTTPTRLGYRPSVMDHNDQHTVVCCRTQAHRALHAGPSWSAYVAMPGNSHNALLRVVPRAPLKLPNMTRIIRGRLKPATPHLRSSGQVPSRRPTKTVAYAAHIVRHRTKCVSDETFRAPRFISGQRSAGKSPWPRGFCRCPAPSSPPRPPACARRAPETDPTPAPCPSPLHPRRC